MEANSSFNSSNSYPPDSCAVCLYEFDSGDEIRQLPNCCHIFHRSCLDRWMDHDQQTCPLCRTRFVANNLMDGLNERLWASPGRVAGLGLGGSPGRVAVEKRLFFMYKKLIGKQTHLVKIAIDEGKNRPFGLKLPFDREKIDPVAIDRKKIKPIWLKLQLIGEKEFSYNQFISNHRVRRPPDTLSCFRPSAAADNVSIGDSNPGAVRSCLEIELIKTQI